MLMLSKKIGYSGHIWMDGEYNQIEGSNNGVVLGSDGEGDRFRTELCNFSQIIDKGFLVELA
eukprot:9086980-Ditylum_brightwellii.AAC.1